MLAWTLYCRDHITALRERERKHRHAINMAKRSREQASKFLKETMTRYVIGELDVPRVVARLPQLKQIFLS